MLQVKIIRCSAANLEGEINNFLLKIGSQPGYKVSVPDIKVTRIGGNKDLEEALILFNMVKVDDQPATTQKVNQQPSKPKRVYDPVHGGYQQS